MKRDARGVLIFLILALPLGCTVRYSHTIAGSIQGGETYKVVNSASGTDVWLGTASAYLNGQSGIAFSDPDGAKAVANYPCDVQFSQVDYRSRFYAYWVRVDFPKVEVTTYCFKDKQTAAK